MRSSFNNHFLNLFRAIKSLHLVALLANILEHYDSALFGLLAPFMATHFFAGEDPTVALIMTYAIIPLGVLSRPFGALFFGHLGSRFGKERALSFSLLGVAVATLSIGLIPSSSTIGPLAALLLACVRMVQAFFAAGGSVQSMLLTMEHTSQEKRPFMSGLYNATTMGGILLASLVVTCVGSSFPLSTAWRYLFFTAAATGVCNFLLALRPKKKVMATPIPLSQMTQTMRRNKRALFSIIVCSGFSYATYAVAFVLMNGFIPLVTSIPAEKVLEVNSMLLVVDMLLLPLFGYLSERLGKHRVMASASLLTMMISIPVFSGFEGADLVTVTLLRSALVTLGVAFAAPYHAWAIEQVPEDERDSIVGFGSAIGSQLLGAPASSISLWLFYKTGMVSCAGIYLAILGCAGGLFIVTSAIISSVAERKKMSSTPSHRFHGSQGDRNPAGDGSAFIEA